MTTDRKVSIFIIAFGCVATAISNTFSRSTAIDPVGPALYPLAVSVVITILGVLMALSTIKDAKGKEEKAGKKVAKGRTLIYIIAICLGYWIVFDTLGFIITNTLTLLGIVSILGERNMKKVIVFALATTLILYFVFRVGLGILLPPIPFLNF